MPSNHNLAFNKRCNEPDLRCAQKADITLLVGLMHGDEHTAAIIAAGNLHRVATSDRSVCRCARLIFFGEEHRGLDCRS